MDLFVVKDIVEKMLRFGKPTNKESDTRLVANIWYNVLKDEIKNGMTAEALLQKFAEGSLPSYDSITRVRRKLQEKNPELRGENYYLRQKEQETVKEQLKEI